MIILVRHPPTQLNIDDRIRGQLDPPVPLEGVKVAERTASYFKDVHVDHIYCDHTKRAVLMAKKIAAVTKAPITNTGGLQTWNLGDYEGQKQSAVAKDIIRHMTSPTKAVPGGESFETFAKRFIRFFLPFYHSAKTVVMVTHGRPIMTAKSWQEADADSAPVDLAGDDLSAEATIVDPGGIAIMGSDRPFEVIKGIGWQG